MYNLKETESLGGGRWSFLKFHLLIFRTVTFWTSSPLGHNETCHEKNEDLPVISPQVLGVKPLRSAVTICGRSLTSDTTPRWELTCCGGSSLGTWTLLCTRKEPTRPTFSKVQLFPCKTTNTFSSPACVNDRLFLVTGNKVWKYTRFVLDYGYPKEVKRIPPNIDAALFLEKNKKLVFIKVSMMQLWVTESMFLQKPSYLISLLWCCPVQGSEYWQWDELLYNNLSVYPKPLSMLFTRIPPNVDAAFTWTNGKIFFFKGDEYWRVNEMLRVDRGYPLSKRTRWMRC